MADNTVEINVIARDLASQVFRDIGEAMKGIITPEEAIAGIAATAGVAVATFAAQSVRAAADFGKSVQEMIDVTGETPQVASQMVLLFQDFGLSASNATTAAKTLNKEGLQLNIETLKDLALKFQALEDPVAKQQFLIDNLGRAGFQYSELLSKTPEQIDAIVKAMDPLLISTDKNRQAMEDYSLEVNQLNQHWLAVKISFAHEIIPSLSALLVYVNQNWQAVKFWTDALYNLLTLDFSGFTRHMLEIEAQLTGPVWQTLGLGGAAGTASGIMGAISGTPVAPPSGWSSGDWNSALSAYDTMMASGGAITTGGFGAGFRDNGGRGEAGRAYMIGRGAQPEMYVPDSAGTFYPNGAGGNFTFVYSPMFSMGSRQEAETVMAPVIEQVVRRMQRDGRA